MGAPFHAMAMMDPRLTTTGFGSYRDSAYTWQMGAAVNVGQGMSAAGTYPVYFPGNLSTEPLTAYSGNEYPNPQLACPGYTGLPLFVEVGANVNTTAGAVHTLTANGASLNNCVIDSTNATYASYLKWRGGVIVFPPAAATERHYIHGRTHGQLSAVHVVFHSGIFDDWGTAAGWLSLGGILTSDRCIVVGS